jgi:hypothetical protein
MFDITRHPQTGLNANIARLLRVTHLRHGVRFVHDALPPFVAERCAPLQDSSLQRVLFACLNVIQCA